MEAGTIVIGTEINTKKFEKQLEQLEKQNASLKDKQIKLTIDETKAEAGLKKIENELEIIDKKIEDFKITNPIDVKYNTTKYQGLLTERELLISKSDEYLLKLDQIRGKQKEITSKTKENSEEMSNIVSKLNQIPISTNSIGKSINNITKKVVRWGLAIFGIRSAYMFIRQSMSTLSQYNSQLATDLQYIRYALANTLQPLIEGIVKLVYQLLNGINAVSKSMFGFNLFAKATAKNFASTNKSAKELNKTLTGWDEANILNKNGTVGSAGSLSPSIDLSEDNIFANWNLDTFIKKGKEIAENIAKGINKFFKTTNWSNLGKTMSKAFAGIVDIIVAFIKKADWKLIGSSIADYILSIEWGKIALKLLELLIESMIATMYLMAGVTEKIVDKFTDKEFYSDLKDAGLKIMQKLIEGAMSGILGWENVYGSIFTVILKKAGMKEDKAEETGKTISHSLIQGFIIGLLNTTMIGRIGSIFASIIKLIKDVLGIHSPSTVMEDIGKNMMLGLRNGIKNGINGVIDLINTLIKKINNALQFKWNDITIAGVKLLKAGSVNVGKIPTIPKLARGGIVNQPGKGVMMGSYLAGEGQSPEAVIPLDDITMNRLGEAIASHMTINANMNNYMNGRLISREIQKIQNQTEFAVNR